MLPLLQTASEITLHGNNRPAMATWALIAIGVLVVFVVIPLLQKKLRIFTRGTIAFIVSALMVFTVIDGLIYLNDIQHEEQRLKAQARFSSVGALIQSYLQKGPEATVQGEAQGPYRDALAESLAELEKDLQAELLDRNSPAESPRELELVALDVGRDLVHKLRYLNPAHYRGRGEDWGFEALIDDGRDFYMLEGFARVDLDPLGTARVLDLRAKLSKRLDPADWRTIEGLRRARAYVNADYRAVARDRRLVLLRASER